MNPSPIVDLRSDTVTQPSSGMRAAMMAAPLGDDVFGDDPTVNRLQQWVADTLGFEAALFTATGTQSNLCAILSHCARGDEYLVGQMQHCYRWEGGGAAVFGSVQPQPIAHADDGSLPLAEIEAAIKPDDPHFARTRLLALENTLGGVVMGTDYLRAATQLAHSRGLATHLDGARLYNAAVALAERESAATGNSGTNAGDGARSADQTEQTDAGLHVRAHVQARRLAQGFDSVSLCLSKGLGAPAGSVLCGSRDFIARARRVRKMAGGAMRQAGVIAAAGLYALEHQVADLARDHALARRLAQGLADLPGVRVQAPQSNIVFVDLDEPARSRASGLLDHLKARGVLATGLYRLRFVAHRDVDAPGVDRAIAAMRGYFQE